MELPVTVEIPTSLVLARKEKGRDDLHQRAETLVRRFERTIWISQVDDRGSIHLADVKRSCQTQHDPENHFYRAGKGLSSHPEIFQLEKTSSMKVDHVRLLVDIPCTKRQCCEARTITDLHKPRGGEKLVET